MKDKHKTNVTFYIEEYNGKEHVLAVFPKHLKINENMICYSTIGQHSEVCLGYIDELRLATKKEYTDLANELENIVGYNLNIK